MTRAKRSWRQRESVRIVQRSHRVANRHAIPPVGLRVKLREVGGYAAVGISLLCAVTMTVIVLRQQFGAARSPSTVSTEVLPDSLWAALTTDGRRIGVSQAPITIVEFADFECPYCRTFALDVLPGIRDRLGDRVALVYRHFPLPYHRFARPSAQMAECAAEQGRFEAAAVTLFQFQDSLGLISFEELARRSGVTDSVRFATCLKSPTLANVVQADFALGQQVRVDATPTVAINRVLYRQPLTSAQLNAVLDSLIALNGPP